MSYVETTPSPAVSARPGVGVVAVSLAGFGMLAVASWLSIVLGQSSGAADLFRSETWDNAWGFLQELLGKGSDGAPAFLDAGAWHSALALSLETLGMSVLAIGLAGAGVLATFLPAARNVAFGDLSGSRSIAGPGTFIFVRAAFVLTRGIPEMLLAMVVVFVLAPGVLPGAVALGIHNYGILGKLSAEVVENMDPRPARALRAAGASQLQMLAYGVLPQALPQLLTFLLYRWEVVIRTTVVVGFVGAGGLGQEFRLRMSYFHYDHVALLLVCYLVLVVGVDLASAGLRRLAR